MVKRISGYIRAIPSGDPLTGIPVSILSDLAPYPPISPSDTMVKGSANPVTTDASTGFFEWTCELSPGPVRIDALIGPGEHKIRSGDEVMQADDFFVSDVPAMFDLFATGVVGPDDFVLFVTGLTLTVQPGRAIIDGYLFEADTTRVLTLPPNTTLATRNDYVVLQQWVGGPSRGKQTIALKIGTVNGTNPPLNTDPLIHEVLLASGVLVQNAGTPSMVDTRVFTYQDWQPTNLNNVFRSEGNSATSATVENTTSQSTYQDALSVTFNLPQPGSRWTVHLWGGAGFAVSAAALINRRVELVGLGSNSPGFGPSISPTYTHYPLNLHVTNVPSGSQTMRVQYKVDPDEASSIRAYCRAPYLHMTAWRTT